MRTTKSYLIAFLSLTFFCCNNSGTEKKEKELLEKEVAQKNKELELLTKEAELLKQKDSLKTLQLNTGGYNLADTYEKVKNSVFLIFTTDDISISQGSAFIINSNGDAISNYHVFENASKAIAINSSGKKFIIDKIYKYDKENDYIIFKIGPNFNDFNPVAIAKQEPRIGDECFAIGNPRGLMQTLSSGIISSYRENNRLIQTTAEITNGSSGGALFNKTGEVIGITTSGFGQANLNFAINIKSLPLSNYYNNSNFDITDTYISNSENETIKAKIRGYFNAILNQDYSSVLTYYSNFLDRWYDKFNISPDDAINEDFQYRKIRGIVPKEINIDWSSFEVTKNNSGYIASLQINYSITRTDITKPTEFALKIFIEFNSEYKIRSIYENILYKF